jgi:hypothetical protein
MSSRNSLPLNEEETSSLKILIRKLTKHPTSPKNNAKE